MNIIFFDGYCGLCNGFVDFILKVDKKKKFNFSPLQSDFAKARLETQDIEDLKSVIVLIDGKTYRKADGVFRVLNELGGLWKLSLALKVLPHFLQNFGYDLVAENRYRLFGKRETCRLPSAEEKSRFIL